jgi:pyruvate dehydrogenase E2 component (dihydrolipoamide acetyltransferase)
MSIEIIVPRLGWSMDEGTFSRWLKQEGELIREGDELFELEGDKATQVVESFDSGILHIAANGPQPGDTVKVGDVLGHLHSRASGIPTTNPTTAVKPEVTEQPDTAMGPISIVPSNPAASHKTTHIRGRRAVTPRAARVAAALGVNTEVVLGTGKDGRIRECDVRRVGESTHDSDAVESTPQVAPVAGTPIALNRRIIAERMIAASQQSAAVTLMASADASALIGLREECKRTQPDCRIPSYTGLFVKLSAAALEKHPPCRAQWINNSIVMPEGIHVSVAVDTPQGLVTPVIRDVVSLPLCKLSEQLGELIELARARRLSPEQMQGGIFTVSNLGMSRVEAFTPILNSPQTMILGVGRIVTAPVVRNGEITAGQVVSLSLTFDHRVIDGAPAAAFLTTLCELIESPLAWLVA